MSLNLTILTGNLGSEPRFLTTPSTGRKKASFSIATSRTFKAADGTKTTQTEWTPVVAWGRLADRTEKLLRKGSFVLVQGEKRSLAPFYDIVSTVVYDNLNHKFAMKVGRARTLDELSLREWQRFAQDADVDLTLVRTIVNDVCESVRVHAPDIARRLSQPGLDGTFLTALADTVVKRAEACSATIPRRRPHLAGGE